MQRHALVFGLVTWIMAACSSTPTAQAPAAPTPQAAAPAAQPSAPPAAAGHATPADRPAVQAMHLDAASALSRERSVYFSFDDATIARQYAPVIERHGQYLQRNGTLRIVVQGNTDERGGSEYNLALGQRRADAVKAALRIYGVRDAQVEAISFGEEKPMEGGHDESSWQKNRRADIVYQR
jgi:peptidoglycan-associated lipoprotein